MTTRGSVLVLSIVLAGRAYGGFSIPEWEFYKHFAPDTAGEYTRIFVDRETFDKSQTRLADIRIADSADREIPYQLIRGTEWHSHQELKVRVLNNSYAPGKYSVVVIDLGKAGRVHNIVDLDITSHNFKRNVEVLGSDDRTHWFVLRDDAAICDFSSKDDSLRVDRITYPESIYRYVQVRIFNGQESPLVIRHPRIIAESTPARTVHLYTPARVVSSNDEQSKQSVFMIDAGYRNLPITGIVLTAQDKNFYRSIQIFAGNDTAQMVRVHSDVLYRYDTPRFSDERLTVNVQQVQARFLKLIIFNHDDRPVSLTVHKFVALEYSIVLKSAPGPMRLYFGNPKAQQPLYDLAQTLRYVDLQNARSVSPGPIIVNPSYSPIDARPWTERHPVVLWVVFCSVFVILGLLVLRMARTAVRPQ